MGTLNDAFDIVSYLIVSDVVFEVVFSLVVCEYFELFYLLSSFAEDVFHGGFYVGRESVFVDVFEESWVEGSLAVGEEGGDSAGDVSADASCGLVFVCQLFHVV